MKRIATIIALLLLAVGASAQISNVENKMTSWKIASARAGMITLKCSETPGDKFPTFYLVINSSNQFDDPLILYLGYGEESATRTLEDLAQLAKSIGKGQRLSFTTTTPGRLHEYNVTRGGKNVLIFQEEMMAGIASVTAYELRMLRDAMPIRM